MSRHNDNGSNIQRRGCSDDSSSYPQNSLAKGDSPMGPSFASRGSDANTESHHRAADNQNQKFFSSSEDESMAEIDDDFDDESCSSAEDVPAQRLDTLVEGTKDVTPMAPPPETEIRLSASRPLVVIRAEESCSEISEKKSANKNHSPTGLPDFSDPRTCMWTSSHAANCPSEDRSCSLVNVLLRPEENNHNRELIRLSLWSVIDGHGGGCVATYASEVLLPLIAASVSRACKCVIVDRGVCTVNGELRDANALDLDGLIRSSDRSRTIPNSVQYTSPSETVVGTTPPGEMSESETVAPHDAHSIPAEANVHSPILPRATDTSHSISSAKTSVKTAISHPHADSPVGTHSATEIANITRAITESFLAVDEGWINSIDPIASHQTSCQSNGRWNAGACALVVFTLQRLEWTSAPLTESRWEGIGRNDRRDDASLNRDAARRRRLDFVAKGKSASSVSTVSSSSCSMLTTEDPNMSSALESEVTETEDDEVSDMPEAKARYRHSSQPPQFTTKPTAIRTPGSCGCHHYLPYDAMLYTAHVGDCRAVLLGSAPPRTIKVGPVGESTIDHSDTTDDESSYHSSDETECLSSSDHDAESSDEEDHGEGNRVSITAAPPHLSYMRRPSRRPRMLARRDPGLHAPFVALPPLRPFRSSSGESESEAEGETGALVGSESPRPGLPRVTPESPTRDTNAADTSQASAETSPPLILLPNVRPIDLTIDHSAYNPSEVSAVLRRCNNAPRAISAGVGGGIKRVAGSLAVTRALGDAYLKTPLLSFGPYKSHVPYITARPDVNCRLLAKDGDRLIILATDGVWERCTGEDVLRWVRNYTAERIADAERRNNRRWGIHATERVTAEVLYDDSPQESPTPEDDACAGQKRERLSPLTIAKKRKVIVRNNRRGSKLQTPGKGSVADVIVRRVLNKVRRARNMSSIDALMALPKGRARRSKHDDITASVVDLSRFVS